MFSTLSHAHFERLQQYYILRENTQKFVRVLQEHVSNAQYPELLQKYDHALVGTQSVSDFVCTCVAARSSIATSVSASVVQMALAAYTMLYNFGYIIKEKKEFTQHLSSMTYEEMMVQYPFLVVIEQQIKMMELLIEMSMSDNEVEKICACIHLPQMILPGPYERYSKKAAKKMYKKCCDKNGRLVDIDLFLKKHPYRNFHKKVAIDWKMLLMNVSKFPQKLQTSYSSKYALNMNNTYNQSVLDMIQYIQLHAAGQQCTMPAMQNTMGQRVYNWYVVHYGLS